MEKSVTYWLRNNKTNPLALKRKRQSCYSKRLLYWKVYHYKLYGTLGSQSWITDQLSVCQTLASQDDYTNVFFPA